MLPPPPPFARTSRSHVLDTFRLEGGTKLAHCHFHTHHTVPSLSPSSYPSDNASKKGMNLVSFSTTVSFCTPASRMDRVNVPGPGPTSITCARLKSPATRTNLAAKKKGRCRGWGGGRWRKGSLNRFKRVQTKSAAGARVRLQIIKVMLLQSNGVK